MGCCSPIEVDEKDTVGECPDCGMGVDVDGDTNEEGCSYSPIDCKTCGFQPCDLSC